MQGHFKYGFTMTHERKYKQNEQPQILKQEPNPKQESMQQQSSQNMLFMIGNKQLAQNKRHNQNQIIDIEQSSQSNDSDKTINLKQQQRKKNNKHKKNKKQKHKKKHKNKQSKQKRSSDHQQNQQQKVYFDAENQESSVEEQCEEKKKHKKDKKIKKHKKDKHKLDKEKIKISLNENQKGIKIPFILQQSTIKKIKEQKQNQLFPSLLQTNKLHFNQHKQTSLVPLPSLIEPTDPSKHLYTQYFNKLQQNSLLPARTIKQMSSSIINKNQEFSFLYENDSQRFNKELYLEFFTNGKFPEYLKSELKFDVIRFPTKDLYTYGKHMDKDIPRYQLIKNFNKVIGVKAKKQHKYEKIMKQIYRSLNQKDYSYHLKDTRDKGNDDRYFHYEGYERLQGVENLVERRQKLRILKLKTNKSRQEVQISRFISTSELLIEFDSVSSKLSIQRQLHTIQVSEQQQLKNLTRQLNRQLMITPNDIQLWQKLVDLQDRMFVLRQYNVNNSKQSDVGQFDNSNKQRLGVVGFVMEKKLAILNKALKTNKYNQLLAGKYFQLLFSYLEHSQKRQLSTVTQFQSTQQLSTYILNFITRYPTNSTFWLFYIKLKLHIQPLINLMNTFNHTYIQSIFTQISTMITKIIQNQKSALIIKKLRTISLLILQKILYYYHQHGYIELALAIGIALLEFNLFVPQRVYQHYSKQTHLQKKKKQFQLYWEDYKQQKIGDLKWAERTSWDIWYKRQQMIKNQITQISPSSIKQQGIKQKQKEVNQTKKSYIDSFITKEQRKQSSNDNKHDQLNQIDRQFIMSQRQWHMANPLYNKQRIKKSIQSLVLYEDIQKWLLNYRDSENIIRLIEMVINKGIGMMYVFNLHNCLSQSQIKNKQQSFFERMFNQKCVSMMMVQIKSEAHKDQQKRIDRNRTQYGAKKFRQFAYQNISWGDILGQQLFLKKYWPVQLTLQIFCKNNYHNNSHNNNKSQYNFTFITKLIYTSRILRLLSPKIIPALLAQSLFNKIYQLNEYRMFLLGVMYVLKQQLKKIKQNICIDINQRTKNQNNNDDQQNHSTQLLLLISEIDNLQDQILESDSGLLEQMREIIGWWQINKPQRKKFIQQYYKQKQNKQQSYNQIKLWAMYIYFEWIKMKSSLIISSIKSITQSSRKIIVNKLLQCVQCYQQLIVRSLESYNRQDIESRDMKDLMIVNNGVGLLQILRVCRYYVKFLQLGFSELKRMLREQCLSNLSIKQQQIRQKQNILQSIIEQHSLKLMSIVSELLSIDGKYQQIVVINDRDNRMMMMRQLDQEFISIKQVIKLSDLQHVSMTGDNSNVATQNNTDERRKQKYITDDSSKQKYNTDERRKQKYITDERWLHKTSDKSELLTVRLLQRYKITNNSIKRLQLMNKVQSLIQKTQKLLCQSQQFRIIKSWLGQMIVHKGQKIVYQPIINQLYQGNGVQMTQQLGEQHHKVNGQIKLSNLPDNKRSKLSQVVKYRLLRLQQKIKFVKCKQFISYNNIIEQYQQLQQKQLQEKLVMIGNLSQYMKQTVNLFGVWRSLLIKYNGGDQVGDQSTSKYDKQQFLQQLMNKKQQTTKQQIRKQVNKSSLDKWYNWNSSNNRNSQLLNMIQLIVLKRVRKLQNQIIYIASELNYLSIDQSCCVSHSQPQPILHLSNNKQNLQSDNNNNKRNNLSVLKNKCYFNSRDYQVIFNCNMNKLYKWIMSKLKQFVLFGNLSIFSTVKYNNNPTDTNLQLLRKKQQRVSQHRIQQLITLATNILSLLSSINGHSKSNQIFNQFNKLIQLKQVIYQVITINLQRNKNVHLVYLSLIDRIINIMQNNSNTNKQQIISINKTNKQSTISRQLQKYQNQYQQIIDRMDTNGIRLIVLKPSTNQKLNIIPQ